MHLAPTGGSCLARSRGSQSYLRWPVAHSMTEDPEDRGYRPTRLWGHWQLQSFSISNGDGRWPVGPPGVKGQGRAM